MTAPKITLLKLTLEGFGPYREKTEFVFNPGANCYISGNETGKTTMLAGLIATIFGLSRSSRSSSGFTAERFRNWENPAHFCGDVFFAVNNHYYRVWRDFETHRVELWELDEALNRQQLLVEGSHNPEARKPLQKYTDMLHSLLGVSSQELFSDTFCLEQPLPEPQHISAELQGLLSGGKGASFHNALDNLIENLKNLTKYTGPNNRGITRKNMSKDGKLEIINNKINELEKHIEEGKQTADSLVDIQHSLQTVEKELHHKKEQLSKKEKSRQAWEKWQLFQQEYLGTTRERDKLKQSAKDASGLSDKIRRMQEEMERNYDEFNDMLPETGDRLESLVQIDRQLRDLDSSIYKQRESLKVEEKNYDQINEELNKFSGWEWLGADPVTRLQSIKRKAEKCFQDWKHFKQLESDLGIINRDLTEKYAPLTEASPHTLDLVANFDRRYAELNSAEEKALQAYKTAENKMKEYREYKDAFNNKYSDLLELPEGAAEAVDGKLSLLQKKRELEKQLAEATKKVTTPLWLRISGAALLVGLVGFLTGVENLPVLITAVLISAVVGYGASSYIYTLAFSSWRRKRHEIREELNNFRQKVASFEDKLGRFSQVGEAELGRLAQRFSQYNEEKKYLEKMENEIFPETLQELQQELNRAREELQEFNKKMAPFRETFDDVNAAFDQWRSLCEKKQRLQTQLADFAGENWGCSVSQVTAASPLSEQTSEQWQEVAYFLGQEIHEMSNKSVSDVAEQLEDLTETWWQKQVEKAARLTELQKQKESLNYKIDSQKAQLNELAEKRQNIQAEKDELVANIRGVMEKNNHDAAAALNRWKELQVNVKAKESAEVQLNAILQNYQVEDISALESLLSKTEDNVTTCLLRWREHIEQNPGLPGTEQADDYELVSNYLETLEQEIDSFNAETNELENKRNELTKRLATIEGESPLNIAAAEIELAELKKQKEWLEIETDALVIAYQELEQAINEYRHTYKERLENLASSYCRNISGVDRRFVVLDENFNISVWENGRAFSVEHLSKGARDQLYLSIRFAVADLLAEEIKLPLIFDDPFTSTDTNRLHNIWQILQEQSGQRQFIIMSHEETFVNWGAPIEIKASS